MPYLELTADDVGPARTRLTLAYIETVMLWPDDLPRRERVLQAVRTYAPAELLVHSLKAEPNLPIALNAGDLADAVSVLLTMPPIHQVQEDARPFVMKGVQVGSYLYEIVAWSQVNPKMAGMTRVKNGLSAHFSVSSRTIDAEWNRLHSVAHLWAAFISQCHDGDATFPCRLDALPDFLGRSEWFRRQGEALHTPQSPKPTVLDAELTWRAPEGLELPEIEMTFERK